jgi:hypothetical protein
MHEEARYIYIYVKRKPAVQGNRVVGPRGYMVRVGTKVRVRVRARVRARIRDRIKG